MTSFDIRSIASNTYQPWREEASCTEVFGDLWFPETGEDPRPAKKICLACPALAECREFALSNPDESRHGIWGALTPEERRNERLRRSRAAKTERRNAERGEIIQDDAA